MRTLRCTLGVMGLLLIGSSPTWTATVDPHTPVSSDGRVFLPVHDALRQMPGVTGFNGLAAEGRADDSQASFPASTDTPEEYALLLQRQPKTAPVGIESIIGSDIRSRFYTIDYPNRAVGLLTFNQATGSFICTGWLISPNTVATAGHCVHTGGPNGSFSTNVVFYPGRDGATSPFGSCAATTLFTVLGWTNSSDEQYDYGVIKLNCNIGNTVGWFGWWRQSSTLKKQHAQITGYPGDKPVGQQWGSFGEIAAAEKGQIFYRPDTFGGMSGSPVYQPDREGSGCQVTCAMGIHAYGVHGSGNHASNNHGTRITKEVHNNFLAWIAAP